ncbi:QacE family quaternary ammonium compound efflux SMR transporter [Leucobacter weissii]|uniref:QacE family quaternary ammonium compound efflux SMR transporter n=1 Tax=Leucobacter weissii TaxID=1983706 RepID=A0A939MKS3_9MICO|nr:SMR family transporter [Leucobacter weissii]MBO1901755.1 QacE family quaternary ammonium compound efflux SMR transporter [Leucobacter weissii]
MALVWVLGAVCFEVFATVSLRAGVDDSRWYLAATLGYVVSYALLGLALRAGMPVGVAYAIWGAVGVVATAILGIALFGEGLSIPQLLGIGVIVLGVVLVETGAGRRSAPAGGAESGGLERGLS